MSDLALRRAEPIAAGGESEDRCNMAMYTRQIGDVRVHNIIEYSGPTHSIEFLFPKLPAGLIERNLSWLAPHHWVPHMQKFVITIQLWVVHAGANVIVIDTGVGNSKKRPAPRTNMLNTLTLLWLEAAGAGPEQVTHVVHTHLHPDHVGWDAQLIDGKWVPTFPKARYLYPRSDYDWFHERAVAGAFNAGQTAAILEDSVAPIFAAGLAEFIDETKEVAGCLTVEPIPGHTPGQISLRLRSRGEEGIFCGDVMHSPLQIADPALNTAFCIIPDQATASRAAFLARAADRDALIMPCHFGYPYCGRVRRSGDGYAYVPERA